MVRRIRLFISLSHMPKRIKARKKKKNNGLLYFALFLLFVGVFIFFAFKSFASDYIFDAKITKIEEVAENDQVEIRFNQPITSISLDNIDISPFIGFSYTLAPDRKSLIIIPNGAFVLEQKYTITLSGLKGFAGIPVGREELAFYTEKIKDDSAAVEQPADAEQFAQLEPAKSKYVPPATSTVKKPVEVTPHILEGKYIDVMISKQVMTIFENGVQVNQFLVSSGKVGMPTPLGEYKVLRKETNHWSVKYKLWMPYSMNFTGPYYIHELPYWPNGYREGEAHLGIRVSHGCVRLGIGPAKYVFDWAEIGTPIYIHN